MYKKMIPYKGHDGRPWNEEVTLHLEIDEIFEVWPQFKRSTEWRNAIDTTDITTLDPDEVKQFFRDTKDILLEAWGVMSEDGKSFKKSQRYEFEESRLFHEMMNLFFIDPAESTKMIDQLLPQNMQEMMAKADANVKQLADNPETPEELRARIAELTAQLPELPESPA